MHSFRTQSHCNARSGGLTPLVNGTGLIKRKWYGNGASPYPSAQPLHVFNKDRKAAEQLLTPETPDNPRLSPAASSPPTSTNQTVWSSPPPLPSSPSSQSSLDFQSRASTPSSSSSPPGSEDDEPSTSTSSFKPGKEGKRGRRGRQALSPMMTTMEEQMNIEGPPRSRGIWTDDVPNALMASTAASTTSPMAMASNSLVDEDDCPESLADVSGTSVAPGQLQDWFKDKDDLITISTAVVVGVVVAASVFTFDVSIQFIHDLPDIFSKELGIGGGRATGFMIGEQAIPFRCIMPVGAGVLVAMLQSKGFAPPLKFLTRAIEGVVDNKNNYAVPRSYWPVFRKAAASAITLGSGASLGPEAPSVELGANTAAVLTPQHLSKRYQRMLVAAGAAAGVTAAFDAPVAGALFAIEFVLKSSRLGLDRLSTSTVFVSVSVAAGVEGFLRAQGQILGLKGAASHLVGRIPYFSVSNSLIFDVLQFGALGVGCAGAAVLLYEGVRICELTLRPLPRIVSAPLAGALCGAIALKFPQVQYGYIALEEIFRDSTRMSLGSLVGLLFAKVAATSVCVGGGLIGGLFAPSLFLGALVGDIMGQVIGSAGVVDTTSYVVVGAAAVLGAACRAPLTAMALMVEITRDTGLLVPLLAAIGMSSLVTDYLEGAFSSKMESMLIEMYLREKAMFWGAGAAEQLIAAKKDAMPEMNETVACVMSTSTNMYVRHTLPLEQARSAMSEKSTKAAVVVDDNFKVMGVVYLPEVEDEIIRRRAMAARDSNFNRP